MEQLYNTRIVDVLDVSQVAHRYGGILLSRRFLRAYALVMSTGGLVILMGVGSVSIYGTLSESVPYSRIGQLLLISPLISAFWFAFVSIYVWALSALARGSRGVAVTLLTLGVVKLLSAVVVDIAAALMPGDQYPLHLLALGALFIDLFIALAFITGPYELMRANEFERNVFAEPRFGAGWLVEIARLLDFPDVRVLRSKGCGRIWVLLALSVILEGIAFNVILESGTNLLNAAGRQLSEVDIKKSVVGGEIAVGVTVLLLGVGRLLFSGARRLRVFARWRTLQSAAEVTTNDSRPSVLFLRSFEKEQVPLAGARLPWPLRGFDPGAEYGTLEEMIVLGLTHVGPVVAVADPSRHDVPVGAARWQVKDSEWQQFVEAQIVCAGLIVVGIAETSGLWWEIEALKRSPGALAKTIFVFPPGTTRNRDLQYKLISLLSSPVDNLDQPVLPDSCKHVLAVWQSEDTSTVIEASRPSELTYHIALRAVLEKQCQAQYAH